MQLIYKNGFQCSCVIRFWSCALRITPQTLLQSWGGYSISLIWVRTCICIKCQPVPHHPHYMSWSSSTKQKTKQLQVIRCILCFFSLGQLEEDELKKFNITTPKRVHVTKHKLGKQPMMTKTRAMLDNLYRSDTEKLSRLLNDEQYLWKGAGNDSGIVGDSTTQPKKHRWIDHFQWKSCHIKRVTCTNTPWAYG